MRMGPHHLIPGDKSAIEGTKVNRSSMRRVVVFARPYSSSIVGFLISILVSAAIALIPPLLFRTIVDTAIPAGDKRRIVILTIILVVVATVSYTHLTLPTKRIV